MKSGADKADRIWTEETQRLERWYRRIALLAAFGGIGVAAGVLCMAIVLRLM